MRSLRVLLFAILVMGGCRDEERKAETQVERTVTTKAADKPPNTPPETQIERRSTTTKATDKPIRYFNAPPQRMFALDGRQSQFRPAGSKLDDPKYLKHPETLIEFHNLHVDQFLSFPGNGFGRFGAAMFKFGKDDWYEILTASERPILSQDRTEVFSKRISLNQKYTLDRNAGLLFQNDVSEPVRLRIWKVSQIQLMGLVKNPIPTIYDNFYGSGHLTGSKVYIGWKIERKLNSFEKSALKKLESDDELIVETNERSMQMLGAIRAQTDCLRCHQVQVGHLLGAFSYTLNSVPIGTDITAVKNDKELEHLAVIQKYCGVGSSFQQSEETISELVVFNRDKDPHDFPLEAIEPIISLPNLNSLTVKFYLNIDGLLSKLVTLKQLQLLHLRDHHWTITDQQIALLSQLTTLEILRLDRCFITKTQLAQLRKALPQCEIILNTPW